MYFAKSIAPRLTTNFNKERHFAINLFCCMTPDQVHEQYNTIIKGIGGATYLVNRSDESPPLRWELCDLKHPKWLWKTPMKATPHSVKV